MKLVIIGVSKTAKHAFSFINEYKLYDVVGFAVDAQYKKENEFLGLPVYTIDELDNVIDKEHDKLFIAMLWNKLNSERKRMFERLKSEGFQFANLISPTARIRSDVGENCWFHDYSIVQYGSTIGDNVMAMAFSLIGANVKMGSHCFLGTKSTVSGGCSVGEQCFIGINSTIFDDRIVGNKCIVGACSVVKRDLTDCSVCKTSSDSMVIKQYPEDIIESKLQFSLNKH